MLNENVDLSLVLRDGWWVRSGLSEQDFNTIRDVYLNDEYRVRDMPPAMPGEVIVDVGACVGAFSRLAFERNPVGKVFAIEANWLNIPVLERNVGHFARIIPVAMTYETNVGLLDSIYDGSEASGGSVVLAADEVACYTGAQYIPRPELLPTVTLDELVERERIEFIDLLKLDCEGSEYSILEHANCLDRVGWIVGEYHDGRGRFEGLMRRRFPPADWWFFAWGHVEHMGKFWLARRQVRGAQAGARG